MKYYLIVTERNFKCILVILVGEREQSENALYCMIPEGGGECVDNGECCAYLEVGSIWEISVPSSSLWHELKLLKINLKK